jgi:hypothetical protein
MRELVQASTSGSTELAASSDQMSKMSRGLLDSMDKFWLQSEDPPPAPRGPARRHAAAGAR